MAESRAASAQPGAEAVLAARLAWPWWAAAAVRDGNGTVLATARRRRGTGDGRSTAAADSILVNPSVVSTGMPAFTIALNHDPAGARPSTARRNHRYTLQADAPAPFATLVRGASRLTGRTAWSVLDGAGLAWARIEDDTRERALLTRLVPGLGRRWRVVLAGSGETVATLRPGGWGIRARVERLDTDDGRFDPRILVAALVVSLLDA